MSVVNGTTPLTTIGTLVQAAKGQVQLVLPEDLMAAKEYVTMLTNT